RRWTRRGALAGTSVALQPVRRGDRTSPTLLQDVAAIDHADDARARAAALPGQRRRDGVGGEPLPHAAEHAEREAAPVLGPGARARVASAGSAGDVPAWQVDPRGLAAPRKRATRGHAVVKSAKLLLALLIPVVVVGGVLLYFLNTQEPSES